MSCRPTTDAHVPLSLPAALSPVRRAHCAPLWPLHLQKMYRTNSVRAEREVFKNYLFERWRQPFRLFPQLGRQPFQV